MVKRRPPRGAAGEGRSPGALARRLLPLLAAAMLVPVALRAPAAEPVATDPAAPDSVSSPPALLRVAEAELKALSRHANRLRAPQLLMFRNLSRYFIVYEISSDTDELQRLLGTLERVTRSWAEEVYEQAEEAARRQGAAVIGRRQVQAALARSLPWSPNPYKELVFFPQAPEPRRLPVEVVDLTAFRDTGFGWQTLAWLAREEVLPDAESLPMEEGAVQLLGNGVSAYGLLILRLSGMLAREEKAPLVSTYHLRQAAKDLAERVGEKDGEAPPAPEAKATLFTEVAAASGVRFRHVSSDWISQLRRYSFTAPSFSGGGVAAGDLDGDPWPDLVFCGGEGCAAFRNRGDGTFEEITAASGIHVPGEARMPILADFDNDGVTDFFVTYARDTNRLFRGLGGGRFEDVTRRSGLEQQGDISGPAAAFDYDLDGLLDLYVGNFGNYFQVGPDSEDAAKNGQPNRLYRNLGDLRFADVTAAAGVDDTGWAQALSHVDFDRDGDQDLYVANDFGRNELFVNQGDGTFSRGGSRTGSDDRFHGMNVGFADLNRDLHPDLFITNIWTWSEVEREVTETNTLLLSEPSEDGGVAFRPDRDAALHRHDSGWSWAGLFFDQDNDGDDDLYVVNGFTPYMTFAQFRPHPTLPDQLYPVNNGGDPNLFFRNAGGVPDTLVEASGAELPGVNSRGVALLDYDLDGDLDMAVSTFHSEARLFRNDGAPAGNHWLALELEGDPEQGSSRDAIGAQVVIRGEDGLYVWRPVSGGEGYLSMSTPAVEAGLGDARVVDVEIDWPGMKKQELKGVEANRRLRVRQGQPADETEIAHPPQAQSPGADPEPASR